MKNPDHEPEYVDAAFEAFRQQRLARNPEKKIQPTPVPPAAPAAQAEPDEGYLDDEFAKFRTARLKRSKVVEEPKPEPAEPEVPDHGMFFGTTTNERRQIRAREASDRESRKMSRKEVERATAQTKRLAPGNVKRRPSGRVKRPSGRVKRPSERVRRPTARTKRQPAPPIAERDRAKSDDSGRQPLAN